MSTALPIAVFASGGGRSLENLAARSADGSLDARVRLVVCDKPGAGVLARAQRLGIETQLLPWDEYPDSAAYSTAAFEAVEAAGCELVVLAGFLRFVTLPQQWGGRVINIHPSLLPAFGGKGYWGMRVHRAAIERGVQFSGCTVHYVDEQYDHGPILLQRVVPVDTGMSPDELAARVFEAECLALPDAVAQHIVRVRG